MLYIKPDLEGLFFYPIPVIIIYSYVFGVRIYGRTSQVSILSSERGYVMGVAAGLSTWSGTLFSYSATDIVALVSFVLSVTLAFFTLFNEPLFTGFGED
ncbi:hypothetical protein H6787_00115 [Candidatus Nomurabacteria bacterium]|nr:hypothetical protein [Candidatus Nomurabacteria bacterium]